MILAWHRSDQTSKRLNCIPGVGPLLATALVATVADPARQPCFIESSRDSGPTIVRPLMGFRKILDNCRGSRL
jgi:hypothetical protein